MPLSNAERQRRHRAKQKAQLGELKARREAEARAKRDIPEAMRQANRFDVAARIVEEHKAKARQLQQEIEPLRAQLAAVRQVIRSLVAQLSLAGRLTAQRHLKEAGYIEWLDAD